MAAGDTWPARRIQVPDGLTRDGLDELIFSLELGDYVGPIEGFMGDKPAVFMRLPVSKSKGEPVGGLRHVTSPPHVFTEQADGSLEIRESLGCFPRKSDGSYAWHGYLDAGNVWREV